MTETGSLHIIERCREWVRICRLCQSWRQRHHSHCTKEERTSNMTMIMKMCVMKRNLAFLPLILLLKGVALGGSDRFVTF